MQTPRLAADKLARYAAKAVAILRQTINHATAQTRMMKTLMLAVGTPRLKLALVHTRHSLGLLLACHGRIPTPTQTNTILHDNTAWILVCTATLLSVSTLSWWHRFGLTNEAIEDCDDHFGRCYCTITYWLFAIVSMHFI